MNACPRVLKVVLRTPAHQGECLELRPGRFVEFVSQCNGQRLSRPFILIRHLPIDQNLARRPWVIRLLTRTAMPISNHAELLTAAGTIVALFAFIQAVLEFVDSNAIRRYEKFHEMSRHFDDNDRIQNVVTWLNRPGEKGTSGIHHGERPTIADKEKFACFMEEIYYMMNSNIVRDEVALYTYGYYVKMTLRDPDFYKEIKKSAPYAVASRGELEDFCRSFRIDRPDWSNYIEFVRISWLFDPLKPGFANSQEGWTGRLGFWRVRRRSSAYFY